MNGSHVVSILAGVTAVMAAALGVTSVLRRRRAATRHALLTAAFAVALVLPAASAIAPYMMIRVPIPVPAVVTSAVASLDQIAAPAPADTAGVSSGRVSAVQPAPSGISLAAIVEAIWLLGCLACLVPVAIGLTEMRRLRGRGLPWRHGRRLVDALAASLGIKRPIDIVLCESVSGPMTYGTVRPTIVLPIDAEVWTDVEATRAIVHELEHIRRADWLTQCLARTLCAAYWFNPLVWIARRQLVLEAERASDDAVLHYADASEYADQLVDLARRLSAGHHPFLAMANRRDLSARVRALLDGRQPRGRAGAWLVAGIACAAAALVMVLSPMRLVAGSPQAQAAGGRPHFDVVSVKPCDPSARSTSPSTGGARGGGSLGQASPVHFTTGCLRVNVMIEHAYVLFADGGYSRPSARPAFDLVNVGPDWVRSEGFTIEATTANATPRSIMEGPMLQLVLEDRFKMKVHRETREVPVLELVVAKGGAKLTPFKPGSCVPWDWTVFPPPPLEPGQHRCAASQEKGSDGRYVQNVEGLTLDDWVVRDSDILLNKPPIVNKTGITGLQTFRFVPPENPDDFADALKRQLGLELRPGRGPREFLILDHVERPVPDGPVAAPARAMGPRP